MNTAARLRAERERILHLWAERARERLPVARQEEPLTLRDGLPLFLDKLVEAFEHPAPRTLLEQKEDLLAVPHGRDRALRPGWSLREVVVEYQLLRQVIFDVLEEHAPLTSDERAVVHDAVHSAVRNAVTEFDRLRSAHHRELLAIHEHRFREFVESVGDYAIFTVDPQGVITSWNHGAQRMKGYTADEAIGHHFSMLYPEEGRLRDEPMAHLRSAELEGRFRGEGMRQRKNGELFLADVSITPMHLDGQLRGFTKVVQDLTERNQLVQERDLSRGEAERLRVAAELRERFVQTLTHDLRTPLSAAKAAASLIARGPEDEEKVRRWAHRISDAIDRADGMISDLLDAARIDAGEAMSVRPEACDLRRIVGEACDELRTRHGDRFEVTADGDTRGQWDAQALRRVVDNLLSNALKYGDPIAPVGIRLRRVDSRVHLAVHNRGSVITPDEQGLLFQPFHRTRDARAAGQRGWGLGLTLVRGIVGAHGGMVKLESYPLEGTTFTVDLPVDAVAQ